MSKTSTLLQIANRILPKKKHITISGFPSNEGNVIEIARAIHELTPAKVHILVDNPNRWNVDEQFTRIRLIKKNSIRGVFSYLTSRLVFFTHGLFGPIEPRNGNQVFVNLWHGDGIKQKPEFAHLESSPFPANYTIGTSSVLATQRAVDLRYPQSAVIMTGAPRLRAMLSTEACKSIQNYVSKITGYANYVLWMPTFRNAGAVGRTNARFDSSITEAGFSSALNELRVILNSQGLALVGKFHPLDSNSTGGLVDLAISQEMLDEWQGMLYELIGGSSALVTDYSSVWVEYLILDRPVAFLTPDLEEYTSRRGLFPPDVMDRLPGINLDSEENISRFADSIRYGGEEMLRANTRSWLGIPQISETPASDLIRWLTELTELKELLTPLTTAPVEYSGPVLTIKQVTSK